MLYLLCVHSSYMLYVIFGEGRRFVVCACMHACVSVGILFQNAKKWLTYSRNQVLSISDISLRHPRFTKITKLWETLQTGGWAIAVWSQSISGVSAINPLVAFYDIHGWKREVLFYYFVPYTHRISIPAYAIEQQWWQLGVSKNEMSLMSFIYKMMLILYQRGVISGYISNIYWHASKWSSIFFSHWQCPSDCEFSFPRFVRLLILVLMSMYA
jgi:hypothetical protein